MNDQSADYDAVGNPSERVRWWDYTHEAPTLEPMAGTLLPCGCHIRTPDYEAVLCAEHLADLNAPIPPASAEGI